MIIKEYKTFFTKELSSIYPQTEIDTFFFFLVEEFLNFERIDVVLKPDFLISEDTLSLFKNALERLKKEEPIQYILGKTEFYGLPFLVDKNTLIPRPETEELVEWILGEVKKLERWNVRKSQANVIVKDSEKSLSILDIGTGTGCIPISLAKNLPNAEISAIDISKDALKIAKKNALLNKVAISFFEVDILNIQNLNGMSVRAQSRTNKEREEGNSDEMLKQVQHDNQFNIIVSNPPYVRNLEKAAIKNNVLENEPHLALFVDNENPLIFYTKIADLTKKHLTKNGLLFFEINQYLGKETVAMLQEKGFKNIELKKDVFGNDRMIKCGLV
jgi:release factor glutamine methyltransferase